MKNSAKLISFIHILCLASLTLALRAKAKDLTLDDKYVDKINEPVIGILTIPTGRQHKAKIGEDYEAYVPSSYKKWVEQTGARAIVIPHFLSKVQLRRIMNEVNGILIPGGHPDLIM